MAQYCYVTSTLITSTMQIFRLIMIFPSQLDSTCERSVWLQGQTIVACRVKVSICLQNCNCLREWREVWALHWLCQWGSWLRRPLYCVRMLSHFSCVWLFATLGTIARQASLTTGFSRQEYWSGLPFPPPRYVPDSTQRTGECQSFSTPQAKLPTSLFKLVFSHRVCVCVCVSHSVVSYSLQCLGLSFFRPLCPENSLGKNTGVGCHYLLQGIFLTQGLNPGLLHCRQIPYCLSHQQSPFTL